MIVEFNGKKVIIEDWLSNALDLYIRLNYIPEVAGYSGMGMIEQAAPLAKAPLPSGSVKSAPEEVDLAPIIEEQMADAALPDAVFMNMSELSEEEAEQEHALLKPDKALEEHTVDRDLQEWLRKRDNTFQQALLEKIDELGLKDPDVYNKAGVDRRHFSKIRGDINYRPTKRTAIALAVAMFLNLDDTLDLIGRAGYTLSCSSEFDMVIRFCLERGIHDMDLINGLLYKLDQPLLTG